MTAPKVIRPQPGPQEQFACTSADIAIYGGAAGGGKSWAAIFEPLRHVTTNAEFSTLFLRRNTTQIRNPGGLWDESMKMYPLSGAKPIQHVLEWQWPGGGKVKMSHLEHENTVLDWQGAQIPLIIFDELTHFTKTQFFYMLSRNRSTCGVRPYIRATTNPDADSWVADFISWWIDQDTGLPIPERGGKLRWFIRIGDNIIWADTEEELFEKHGIEGLDRNNEFQIRPKSVTFIPAKLSDNKALTDADPDYRANLMALSRVERERLLNGNWKVRPAAGMYFRRSEVTILDTFPNDVVKLVRGWDLAATEPSETNPDPDWTAGVLIGLRKNGRYIVADVVRDRKRAAKVRELIKRTANNDSYKVRISLPQDPGQAGKEQGESYVKELAGYAVEATRESGDKITRSEPFAAQWQAGNVDVLRGAWNEAYFGELEAFGGDGGHDDQVDGSSRAFGNLATSSMAVWQKLGQR